MVSKSGNDNVVIRIGDGKFEKKRREEKRREEKRREEKRREEKRREEVVVRFHCLCCNLPETILNEPLVALRVMWEETSYQLELLQVYSPKIKNYQSIII